MILQSELISTDFIRGGGRGASSLPSWSSRPTHAINSYSCAELLISDENALMKIAPYSHTPLNQVWPSMEQHMTHCVCARLHVSFSFSLCPLFLFLSFKRLRACVSSLSGWISFIHYSAFKPCPSIIMVRVCSKSLHCKNVLIQAFCLFSTNI